jgi:hypothetical protein
MRWGERRYNLFVLAVSVACFAAYIAMVRFVIPEPGYTPPLSPVGWLATLCAGGVAWRDLVFPVLLAQNVMLLAIAVGAVRAVKERRGPRELIVLGLAFAGLIVLGLAGGIDANIGRVVSFVTPAFAALIARDLWGMEGRRMANSE